MIIINIVGHCHEPNKDGLSWPFVSCMQLGTMLLPSPLFAGQCFTQQLGTKSIQSTASSWRHPLWPCKLVLNATPKSAVPQDSARWIAAHKRMATSAATKSSLLSSIRHSLVEGAEAAMGHKRELANESQERKPFDLGKNRINQFAIDPCSSPASRRRAHKTTTTASSMPNPRSFAKTEPTRAQHNHRPTTTDEMAPRTKWRLGKRERHHHWHSQRPSSDQRSLFTLEAVSCTRLRLSQAEAYI